jgi:hypothetical protein
MSPLETKLLWLAIGVGVGYLLFAGSSMHHHHYSRGNGNVGSTVTTDNGSATSAPPFVAACGTCGGS